MSLDFDYGNCECKDRARVGYDDDGNLAPATNSLAWGALCGTFLGVIDEKNYREWIWRIEFLKRIGCPWMSDGSFPTAEEVRDHIGFRTNCFPAKSRAAFIKHYVNMISSDVSRELALSYTSEDSVASIDT